MGAIFRILLIVVFCTSFTGVAEAAKWGKVRSGDCDLVTGKRIYTARLWRAPFDKSGKKLCPKMSVKINDKKYKPYKCEKKLDQGYWGSFRVPDKQCGFGGNPQLQVLPPESFPRDTFEERLKSFALALSKDKKVGKKLRDALENQDMDAAVSALEGVNGYNSVIDKARDEGHQTFAISVAADASLFIGLGLDVSGIAIDTAPKSVRRPPQWFGSAYGTAGFSIAAGGNFVFSSFKPRNYCLVGSSYGLTLAGALIADLGSTTWFVSKESRKVLADYDVMPADLRRLMVGKSFAVGAGLGFETVEYSVAYTAQWPRSDSEKEYCEDWYDAFDRDLEIVIDDIRE